MVNLAYRLKTLAIYSEGLVMNEDVTILDESPNEHLTVAVGVLLIRQEHVTCYVHSVAFKDTILRQLSVFNVSKHTNFNSFILHRLPPGKPTLLSQLGRSHTTYQGQPS
ncbi:hypothetical protein D3C87_1876240 [compost metagenome]